MLRGLFEHAGSLALVQLYGNQLCRTLGHTRPIVTEILEEERKHFIVGLRTGALFVTCNEDLERDEFIGELLAIQRL